MKVDIVRNPEFLGVDVYIYDVLPDGTVKYVMPIEMTQKIIPQGERIEPTLRMDQRDAKVFMQAFAEAFSKEGIKTEDQHRIDGELQATKQHLADMQKIAMMFMEDQHGNA